MDKQKTLVRWTYLVIVLGLLFNLSVYFKYHVPILLQERELFKGELCIFLLFCSPFLMLWLTSFLFNKQFGSFRTSLLMLISSIIVFITGVAMFILQSQGSGDRGVLFYLFVAMFQFLEAMGTLGIVGSVLFYLDIFSKAKVYEYEWEGHNIRFTAIQSHKTLWFFSLNELWIDGKLCAQSGGFSWSSKAVCQIEHAGNPVTVEMITKNHWKVDMGLKYRLLIQGIEVDSGIMQIFLRL